MSPPSGGKLHFMSGVAKAMSVLMVALAALVIANPAHAQGGSEIIRGVVTGADMKPLADASVTITGLVTQTTLTARTNDKGLFTALFPSADGNYVVIVRRIGFSPVTMRIARTGLSSVLVADATLKAVALSLDTLTVNAGRNNPGRGERPSIGGVEQDVLANAMFALYPADLMALIGLTPGVLLTTGDSTLYSVLGAATNQNSTLVDGMKFGGDNLPQDAIANAKLVTSTFDPARGQFAGGQLAIRTKGGADEFAAVIRGSSIDRFTTWADASSPIAAPRIQLASGSIGGAIRKGKTHYMFAADLNFNSADAYSLLSPRDAILSQFGLSRDSISAVNNALSQLGIPPTLASIPLDRVQNRETGFLRLDWTPSATVALNTTFNGSFRQQGGNGISTLGFPSSSNHSDVFRGSISTSFSAYVHGFLDEFTGQFNRGTNSGAPYELTSGGNVRIGVQFDDGRTGLNQLRFGGGGTLANQRSSHSLEATNELSWLTADSHHRFKIGQSIEGDWQHSVQASNRLGTFTYQSLADLEANRPASYTRTISAQERVQNGAIFGLWAGDEWRASAAWQFQGGVRVDLAHQGAVPLYNPQVDTLFGVRTDHVPRDAGVSPRLGFSWTSAARRGATKSKNNGLSFDGTADRNDMLAIARASTTAGIGVTGGVGAFRGVLDPEEVSALIDATGLPSTTRYLTCAGAATPIPSWSTPNGTVFDSCLDGTGPGVFSVTQPAVTVYDPTFKAPVSWRANIGVDGMRWHGWSGSAGATLSLGRNGESNVDLNLQRNAQFLLPSEANRPVYASSGAIISETGIIAPGASRTNADYGQVTSILSDLRSTAVQLNATIAPRRPLFGHVPVRIDYVYSYQRAEQRGFDGSTAGDPFVKEWAPGRQPTHQIIATISPRIWLFALGIRVNVLSGTPYTPTVVGDINGDGRSNDRAFIANPASTPDAALAAQMQALLAAAPAAAVSCLRAQFGNLAGRNSCRTGWQIRTDLNLNFAPPEDLGVGNRLRVTMNLLNTTGALVRLFGLENSALGRSASSTVPDSRLLYVTGFDQATQRFTYQVNQLFGEPQDFGAARRRFPPFQLQIGLEYKLGGPKGSPISRSLALLNDDKGAVALTNRTALDRLARLHPNPVAKVLASRDSLQLTATQVTALEAVSAQFDSKADSLFDPLSREIVSSGKSFTDTKLAAALARITPVLSKLTSATSVRAADILTADQRKRMPSLFPVH